jgi:hypothetical protein
LNNSKLYLEYLCIGPDVAANIYNPSYSKGRGQEVPGSRSAQTTLMGCHLDKKAEYGGVHLSSQLHEKCKSEDHRPGQPEQK